MSLTRMLHMGRTSLVLLALGVSQLAAAPQTDLVVVRDTFGTAHVLAQTDEAAYFGAGYAAAQDRFFEMSWRRLMYLGQTAKYFGRPLDASGSPSNKWVATDRTSRLVGYERHADAVVAALDPATELLLQAYVDGVNRFVGDPGFIPHPLFATYGIPAKPWRLKDVIGVWVQFGSFFQGGGFGEAAQLETLIGYIVNDGLTRQEAIAKLSPSFLCYDEAAVVQQSDVPPAIQQAMQDYANLKGLSNSENCPEGTADFHFSQAWAVAGAFTTEGSAALVGDPRIKVFAPNALYEWSMRGATFDVTGAGIPGVPLMLSAHTPRVAWSPTALGVDQADLFVLETDEVLFPGQYSLDGVWLPYDVDEVEVIEIKNGSSINVRYRQTYWGSVVTDLIPNTPAGKEYARHMVPFTDPTQTTLAGFTEMIRASDVDSLFAASEGWHYPSTNLIMADSNGNIGYTVVGDIPVRHPALELAGSLATTGSVTDYEWLEILPHALRPHVLRPAAGRLLSANHMPVGSWYPIPMRFGTASHGDSIRSRRLRERLEASVTFDVAEVFAIHHDTVNPARRDLVELGLWLRAMQPALFTDPRANAALTHLEAWWLQGATMDNSHYATLLADSIRVQFRKTIDPNCGASISIPTLIEEFGAGDNGLIGFLQVTLSEIHATPPRMLNSDEAAYVEAILARAYKDVTECMQLPDSNQWQAWYADNVLKMDLPTWTTLGGAPSLTPGVTLQVSLQAVDGNTLLSASAQAFTQLIDLSLPDGGQSVLPPGASENAKPGMTSQQVLWETGLFKSAPLTNRGIRDAGVSSVVKLQY